MTIERHDERRCTCATSSTTPCASRSASSRAITPWNSPLLLLAWKLGPALAAGNTVVAKPSEETPVSTLGSPSWSSEAGVPAGRLQRRHRLRRPGRRARSSSHPGVDKIAFTGSTPDRPGDPRGRAAKRLDARRPSSWAASRRTSSSPTPTSTTPSTASSPASSAPAARPAWRARACSSRTRSTTSSSTALAERAGPDHASATRSTPPPRWARSSTRPQLEKVLALHRRRHARRRPLVAGGGRRATDGLDDGLLRRADGLRRRDATTCAIAREEIFGPVARVMRVRRTRTTPSAIANDTEYGLAAGVWTERHRTRAPHRASAPRRHRLGQQLPQAVVRRPPFGGYKQSGLGRENGLDALDEYTEVKSVWIDAGRRPRSVQPARMKRTRATTSSSSARASPAWRPPSPPPSAAWSRVLDVPSALQRRNTAWTDAPYELVVPHRPTSTSSTPDFVDDMLSFSGQDLPPRLLPRRSPASARRRSTGAARSARASTGRPPTP